MVKLEGYGVKGSALRWIGQFLTGRRQRVCVSGSFSGWIDVLSGVPQGSVIGPILFVCFINDLPEKISSLIYLYADDAKIFRRTGDDLDRRALQRDLEQLEQWADRWQMKFNVGKCKVLHLGGDSNIGAPYYMGHGTGTRTELLKTVEEKDLGVWMDGTCKPSNHIAHAVCKANQILGLIRRSFTYIDCSLMRLLFTSLVRPHLEYGNAVWYPYLQKDIDLLESVQHRATRLVPGLAKMAYEDRLRRMNLPTLVYRRHRGDMIEAYKYLNGVYRVDSTQLLPRHEEKGLKTRGHSKKLMKREFRGQIRANSFGMRIVNVWNSLPEEVVTAPSVNSMKGRFDKHFAGNRYSMEWRRVSELNGDNDTEGP